MVSSTAAMTVGTVMVSYSLGVKSSVAAPEKAPIIAETSADNNVIFWPKYNTQKPLIRQTASIARLPRQQRVSTNSWYLERILQ